ncbi:MAG: pyrimidine 5'-nucleotidase [Caulobacterales bacterium 32-69-10]|nr:MAG: pyrimidine 5'-nucleotidase [Caulobacterales bacterium 32-69-10]
MNARADLSQVDTWLFDLDDTLYPPACQMMALVDERMTAFVARQTGLAWDEARSLQKRYYHEHGTTLAGLMQFHGVEPAAFIAEVQDVAMDCLSPDPALRAALLRLEGRRLVFTNAGGRYAEQVLAKLQIDDLFEDVFHIEAADYIPKPQVATFDRMLQRHAVQPAGAAFFEDSERNLAPAAALGMTTVLVGPHALTSTAPFVHHRTEHLAPFLAGARLRQDS